MATTAPAAKKPVNTGRPAGLFTWVAVGLVVVVVAVLVIVKVTSGSSSARNGADTVTSPTIVKELTTIPASVFNAVGVTSSTAQISKPIVLKNQPALSGTSSTGKTVPKFLYIGAEFCPYCAAERWSVIAALSRFGTWSGLENTASYINDVYGGTPSFSFVKSSYTSPYISFKGIEQFNNVPDPANQFYYPLMTTPTVDNNDFMKYDMPAYIPGMTSSNSHAYPFISIGNKWLISGAQYTPCILNQLSRDTIAAGLSTPSSPVTQAILASANYLTAAICKTTNEQPAAVCNSPAVTTAAKGL